MKNNVFKVSSLKVGIILAINTQEDLNELAILTGAFAEDSFIIDGEWVAYKDFDGSIEGSINVRTKESFHSEYPEYKDTKCGVFKRWVRSLK